MAAAVRMLPLELREALLIVVLAGFTHREAASALDISLATLIARLTKARERVAALTRSPPAADGRRCERRSRICESSSDGERGGSRICTPMSTTASSLTSGMAFEKRMAQDPALARRAAAVASAKQRHSRGLRRRGRESLFDQHRSSPERSSGQGPAAGRGRRQDPLASSRRDRHAPAVEDAARLRAKVGAAERLSAVALVAAWARGACRSAWPAFGRRPRPSSPPNGLGEAGVAAFRAFARPGVAPVELATGDRAESQEWLTTRLLRPVYLPATPSAVSLVGARIAPYPGAAAAFLVYKSQDRAHRLAGPVS